MKGIREGEGTRTMGSLARDVWMGYEGDGDGLGKMTDGFRG